MDSLAKELSEVVSKLEAVQDKLSAYEDLKTQIKLLRTQTTKSGKEGLNCHVELTLKEAETAADRWIEYLNKRVHELASKRAVKKAQIRLISEKLQHLSASDVM